MAKIYANLIRDGLKTIDQVPPELVEQVKKICDELNIPY